MTESNDVTVKDILMKARELIAPDRMWGKGSYTFARPDGGEENVPADGSVRCFCAVGSVMVAAEALGDLGLVEDRAEHVLLASVNRKPGWEDASVESWNDDPDRTKAEVLALFDEAIEAAE